MASSIKARLDLAPAEAVDYFAAKTDQPSFDYTDLWREQHVHTFTVAKATTTDVLRTIRTEVEKAVGEGQTLAEFKRTLRPRLEALGWWGRKEVLDGDTGEVSTVQLGSERRLRTIYQTNVQTAYQAGRYKRYVANAADRPYWRYVAVMDGRTRPTHAALNGKVWRWDDPIWAVIWPPNGWGCRCTVVALTEEEFQALGVPLENGSDAVTEVDVPIGKDGQTVKVKGVRYTDSDGKEKVFRPDPGWDYNPGADWSTFDAGGAKSEGGAGPAETPTSPAGTMRAADGLSTWSDAGRPDLSAQGNQRLPAPQLLPAAPTRDLAERMLVDTLLGPAGDMRVVTTPIEKVALRAELLPAVASVDSEAHLFANFVVPTLEKPFEVWLTPYDDGIFRTRYLALFDGPSPLLMMVRQNRDGSLFWEPFRLGDRAGRLNQLRQGVLLYARDAG